MSKVQVHEDPGTKSFGWLRKASVSAAEEKVGANSCGKERLKVESEASTKNEKGKWTSKRGRGEDLFMAMRRWSWVQGNDVGIFSQRNDQADVNRDDDPKEREAPRYFEIPLM